MNRYEELLEILSKVAVDFEKFYVNGNASAGTRARKAMQDLKVKAQEIRTEIQEIKNAKEAA